MRTLRPPLPAGEGWGEGEWPRSQDTVGADGEHGQTHLGHGDAGGMQDTFTFFLALPIQGKRRMHPAMVEQIVQELSILKN